MDRMISLESEAGASQAEKQRLWQPHDSSSKVGSRQDVQDSSGSEIHNLEFCRQQSFRKMSTNRTIAGSVVSDVFCVFILGLTILIFHLSATPFHRGFFCDDDSIKYPYHDSTITSLQLYLLGVLLNISTMFIFEIYIFKYRNQRPQIDSDAVLCSRKVHPLLWQLYHVVGVFGFACCASQTLTDIGKYAVGRLRPHFLDICKPDPRTVSCSAYVVDFKCTGGDAYRIREGRLSFPSGHASFSAVTMVYLILYIQARYPWRRFLILRTFIQVAAYAVAFYTALSRVSDYKHHPTDVLAGHILGSVVAIITAFTLSGLFQMPKPCFQTENQRKDVEIGRAGAT